MKVYFDGGDDVGAWGVGIWENDTALDVKGDFEAKLSKGQSKGSALINTIDEWKNDDWEDVVYALAALQLENNILVNKDIISKAIEYSAGKSDPEDYSNPKDREAVLESFLLSLQKFDKN